MSLWRLTLQEISRSIKRQFISAGHTRASKHPRNRLVHCLKLAVRIAGGWHVCHQQFSDKFCYNTASVLTLQACSVKQKPSVIKLATFLTRWVNFARHVFINQFDGKQLLLTARKSHSIMCQLCLMCTGSLFSHDVTKIN